MKLKILMFLTLLIASTSAISANLWTARGDCTFGGCDGSLLPYGIEIEFNLFLDDSTLGDPPGLLYTDPALMLAFQVILDPDDIFGAPPGTLPEFLFLGTDAFEFITTPSNGDPYNGLFLGGTYEFCSNGTYLTGCSPAFGPAGWSTTFGGDGFGGGGTISPWLDWMNTGPAELPQVPIPAAAWLFGSALLGLGALKRKKA